MQSWLSILMLFAVAIGFGAFTVFMSNLLGPSRPSPEKSAPYECGVPPVGDARERQSVKFYLVAMVFLLFDIEVAFLYPWAMAMRDLGWAGYIQIVLFTAILAAGYVYIWRKGVLDWGPTLVQRRAAAAARRTASAARTSDNGSPSASASISGTSRRAARTRCSASIRSRTWWCLASSR